MSLPGNRPLSPRWLAPLPLLAGVVIAFAGCCLAGHMLARVNWLRGFQRFHPAINYMTLYYPTVSQVRSLAREALRPDKIAVVLGGNSILLGAGQGSVNLWSKHLQRLLGDDFRVLNLAQPGAGPFEFGPAAAEVLLRDHPRLIFVTDAWTVPRLPEELPDGRPPWRYLYWQARARGLLADHPERDAALRRLERWRGEDFHELRRQCELDARLSFHDLWNAVTYRCASTVWCPLLAASWTRPRRDCPDPPLDPPPATESRLEAASPEHVPAMRKSAAVARAFFHAPDRERGRAPASPLPRLTREGLCPSLRGRTLLLITRSCPYYERQLTTEEKEWYYRSFAVTADLYGRAGVRAVAVGRGLSARHYVDAEHLTAEGGRRLAAEVAPLIRDLAEHLGYRPALGLAEQGQQR